MVKLTLYLVVAVQFAVALSMWYVSLAAINDYETVWTVLLSLNLILLSIIFLVFLRNEGVFSRDRE
ncbi:MAG: hypothetical protein ACYDAZ_01815 [Thermoplasmataceae archaeon]